MRDCNSFAQTNKKALLGDDMAYALQRNSTQMAEKLPDSKTEIKITCPTGKSETST
jgi:hypothetical protein